MKGSEFEVLVSGPREKKLQPCFPAGAGACMGTFYPYHVNNHGLGLGLRFRI